ncbi:serine hydrolase [uncultured Cohaesibacter sp.]|uniref:serine hydrolase n=1 Tax=uncultured Cohaesibacter sp. TaxID=1002546 RepID=UPI0029C6BC94|nr:serine hydrolase [uncultured Cohaesibacter sp.]
MFRVAFRATRRAPIARPAIMIAAAFLMAIAALAPSSAQANSKYAGYVIDVKSGKVLYSNNANSLRYPASLTKMMTLYMVFEKLEQGELSLSSRLKVSRHAAGQAPSKLGLKPGSTISVKDAILALVTKSANDVAAVIAENIGGSESKFASMMTSTARSIGMSRTTFKNASGLPNSQQRTTAADMALLGQALQDRFPTYYKYFNTRVFQYGKARYGNHNKLLGRVKGVDGIKTGYTNASGFNLVTNVKTGDRHIVAVVMGGRTGASRDAQMRKLIKDYLPKAKTGRRMTALVGAPAKRSYVQLAETVPLPKAKTIAPAGTMLVASAAPALPKASTIGPVAIEQSPMESENALETEAVQLDILPRASSMGTTSAVRQAVAASVDTLPAPRAELTTASLTTAALAIPPLPRPANDAIGDLSTHTAALPESAPIRETVPSGWQIQLSATPSLEAANDILDKARASNKSLLKGRVNHTETVQKGNSTLYRARFAGFPSKSAARDACSTLKKQKFACLALNP